MVGPLGVVGAVDQQSGGKMLVETMVQLGGDFRL